MGDYITIESVRRTVGIDSPQIDDPDVTAIITEVENEVPRKFNTVFIPTIEIEYFDGDGSNRLNIAQSPLLAIRELKIDGTTEDPANVQVDKDSGYIWLGQDASISTFPAKRNTTVVKYIYGTVQQSKTIKTETNTASVAGTGVVLSVDSESSFAENDWVEIQGMDGNREVAQITATDTGEITVDKLVLAHEDESIVAKMEIDTNFTKLMNIIAGISMVARIVGESYKDTVGYDLGELHVQKGEPYTQWRETANQLIKERDEIYKMISIRPVVF